MKIKQSYRWYKFQLSFINLVPREIDRFIGKMAHPSSTQGSFLLVPISLLRNEVNGDKFRVQVSFVTPPHPSNPYNIPHSSLECLILS